MKMFKQLLADEAGFVVSTELVLIATVLVIGMVTGLVTLRDGVIQELVDLSNAIGNIEQSYVYNGVTAHTSATNGSEYNDVTDYCETGADTTAAEPGCLDIQTNVPAAGSGETAGRLVPTP